VLAHMGFRPQIDGPARMDARIFGDDTMGLRKHLVGLPFDARFAYDPDRNVLYLNFEQLEVKSTQMVDAILAKVRALCEPLGKRVHAVVNYEGFRIDRDVEEPYAAMATEAVRRYYESVTRFTTSAFLRAKLGDALADRASAPHIFESEGEALSHLRGLRANAAAKT
jgi:propionate CoA-transferase